MALKYFSTPLFSFIDYLCDTEALNVIMKRKRLCSICNFSLV